MDSLTVHYLARELDARWRGRRIRSCSIDRQARSITLAVEGSGAVAIDLSQPSAHVREAVAPAGECTLSGWVIGDVSAPIDDRRLVIRLEKHGKFRGSQTRKAALDVSVVPTSRGAVLMDESGHRLAALGAKLPPPSDPRPLLTPAELRHAADDRNPDLLLQGRWMSPLLARWLIGTRSADIVEAYDALCDLPRPQPSWCGEMLVPFPWCDNARSVPSLVERAESASAISVSEPVSRHARSIARMREELTRAASAPLLRRTADALMALGDVPVPDQVLLPDGTSASISPRAEETAVAAAERMYRDVRSMERALASLPSRIAQMEREESPDTMQHRGTKRSAGASPTRRARGSSPARPFRTYRSSGGLEIWVGRGAASNDALTFREAAPDDVWLHARDAAGAHVVLRWRREEQPPARDLEEAAALAAWHSKLRGSALVPVDWTRRKHVRKVRGGAPGLVTVQRAQTIFARPSAEVERRLRANG